jgi:hemoglobin/transferrin/lactoferrin receptor protein
MAYWLRHPALLACTALTIFSGSHCASAQDAVVRDERTTLQPIVVKGPRIAARAVKGTAAETPLATEVTREEIEAKQVDSLTDLGRRVDPSVSYNKATGGVSIRGLSGPRVKTLIDGIPIPFLSNSVRNSSASPTTNADGGADSFDFSMISALDVVKGADSSRAGEGALGGALLLRTLVAEDLIPEGRDWGGLVKTMYDGEDRSFGGAVAMARQINMTSVLFEGGYKRGHERRTNGTVDEIGLLRTKANPADYNQRHVLLKVRQDLEGGHRLTLAGEHYRRDYTADLRREQGTTYQPGDYWGDETNQRTRVSLTYDFEAESADSLVDTGSLTLYWQELQREAGTHGTRLGLVAGPWLRNNQLDYSGLGLTGYARKSFETGNFNHELTLGIDAQRFGASQYLDGLDACILGTASPIAKLFACPSLHADQADMPDVDGNKFGFFLDDKVSFGDSGFSITPGLRFDWYRYSPKLTPEYAANSGYATFGLPPGQDDLHVSPKLRATYETSNGVEFYTQWASAFRAPTIDELYVNFTNTAQGYANIGNPTLEPETGNGFELGAAYEGDSFSGRVTLFHNRYRNFIDSVTTMNGGLMVTQYQNLDKVRISGFELAGEKRFDNGVNLHAALAYAHGEDTETGDPIRSVGPAKGIVGIGYDTETWGTDLSVTAASGMRDDDDANTFDAPGYGVVDLTAWVEPSAFKGLRIQAGVYNLFDRTYYDALANRARTPLSVTEFHSEAGRSFQVSLTQKF